MVKSFFLISRQQQHNHTLNVLKKPSMQPFVLKTLALKLSSVTTSQKLSPEAVQSFS
jgi:hypothetical protein